MAKNWFESRRVALDLTEVQLAARVGASVTTIRNWEAERCVPDHKFTNATLASAYKTTELQVARAIVEQLLRIRGRRSRAQRKTLARVV
jgi:DNA-binding XRE family transcriptional regulator